MREVGRKFDRWIDVLWLQKRAGTVSRAGYVEQQLVEPAADDGSPISPITTR